MIEIAKNIGIVSAGLVALIGAIYTILKFWGSLKPLRIEPSMHFDFENKNSDAISAKIINRSKETIYVAECFAKEAKPIKLALATHLRNPFIKPKLYPNVWYGTNQYNLLDEAQLKIEAGETKELWHKLDLEHPIAGFSELEFLVKVRLSSGRVIRSHRLKTPPSWHFSVVRRNA